MRYHVSVALLATLSACGGTSIDAPIVDSVVSSNSFTGATTTSFTDTTTTSFTDTTTTSLPLVPPPATTTVGDVTFAGLLNNVRQENGAPPVTFDARLNSAAQAHAQDMLTNDYFSHVGLNGSTVGSRVQNQGYNFSRVGENIAAGYRTEQTVLNGWVNSPGHQRNNIDPRFEEFGLGYVRDGNDTRWVLVLGTEQ